MNYRARKTGGVDHGWEVLLTGTTPLDRRDLESNKKCKTYVVQMLSSQVQQEMLVEMDVIGFSITHIEQKDDLQPVTPVFGSESISYEGT